MKKPTIVAPGGSYTKAIVAAQYGAEEVYIGVPFTSLRMRQNKISWFEELKKTVDALHTLGSKALLTMNIFPRNQDITIFEKTVEQIANVWADAIIFSDPGTFNIIRKYMPDIPLHLSTQASTLNHSAVQFWYDLGVKRIVLARELSLEEIKEIKEKVPGMELEVFVHGAMCMSYSGRCLLGDYMNGRPGNKWECSHACRFKYKVRLEEERRPGKLFQLEEDEDGSHVLSSKDLCVIQRLAEIMPYVDAMKIEGRSKSEFYVASVVKAYTHMRDRILANKEPDPNIVDLVNKIPHRAYWDGFLFNALKDFPETEDVIARSETTKQSNDGSPRSARDDNDVVVSTTLDSAGPLFNRNYFWIFTDKTIEVEGKKYFAIDPKEVLEPGMKIKYIAPEHMWELTLLDIRNEHGHQLEKVNCNTGEVYVLTDVDLQGWEILYM